MESFSKTKWNNNKKIELGKQGNMGIGKLNNPNLTFVRKFRWTLEGDNLPEYLIKDIAFNFSKQSIKFNAYETVIAGDSDVTIHKWIAQDLAGKHLSFTVYDGCGVALYGYKFHDLILVSDKCDFDYAKSDISCRKLKVRYGKVEKTFLPQENKTKTNMFQWELSVNGISKIKLENADRPNLHIEETEVNFVDSKTFMPGKSHWAEISIKLNRNNYAQFVKALAFEPVEPSVELSLCQQEGQTLESWKLDKTTIDGFSKLSGTLYEVKLNYDGVQYIQGGTNEI